MLLLWQPLSLPGRQTRDQASINKWLAKSNQRQGRWNVFVAGARTWPEDA